MDLVCRERETKSSKHDERTKLDMDTSILYYFKIWLLLLLFFWWGRRVQSWSNVFANPSRHFAKSDMRTGWAQLDRPTWRLVVVVQSGRQTDGFHLFERTQTPTANSDISLIKWKGGIQSIPVLSLLFAGLKVGRKGISICSLSFFVSNNIKWIAWQIIKHPALMDE